MSAPKAAWYCAQDRDHLLGLGRLGEGGEAAQVAEHHGHVAAVALEDALVAGGDRCRRSAARGSASAGSPARARRAAPRRAPRACAFQSLSSRRLRARPGRAAPSSAAPSAPARPARPGRSAWSDTRRRRRRGPATTSCVSALAVTRMIGMKGRLASALSCRHTSMPSIFGIITSSRMRSGRCSRAIASASSPSAACEQARSRAPRAASPGCRGSSRCRRRPG